MMTITEAWNPSHITSKGNNKSFSEPTCQVNNNKRNELYET